MSFFDIYSELDFVEVARGISGPGALPEREIGDGARIPRLGLKDRAEQKFAAGESEHTAEITSGQPGEDDVRLALARGRERLHPDDLRALLSPVAANHLEEMALTAREITRRRFGNVMQLYAPLYLSNECSSICSYCGFRFTNKVERITLTVDEALREAALLRDQGIRHVLLLTGEAYRKAPPEYIASVAERLSETFPSVGIEVYPLREEEYRELRSHGVDGLTIYQETYDPVRYQQVHIGGVKKLLRYRLECPDRAGRAGLRRINIGALLGLSDPAAEVFFTALHAAYLMKTYWQAQISISLPRLRPAEGLRNVPLISDRQFVQYLLALRIFLPDVGLTLSTREGPRLRDHLGDLCITTMSAGSRTDPGGYSGRGAAEQFAIEDARSVAQIGEMLRERGLEPVFLDWSAVMK